MLNPHHEKKDPDNHEGIYSEQVAINVPAAYLLVMIVCIILLIFAIIMIKRRNKNVAIIISMEDPSDSEKNDNIIIETDKSLDWKIDENRIKESYRKIKKARLSKVGEVTVNLTKWYACFVSFRFWQFFLLNFLLSAPANIILTSSGSNETQIAFLIVKVIISPIVGIIYDRAGFKPILIFLTILQMVITVILYFIDENNQSKYL